MVINKKAIRYIYRFYHLEDDIYLFDEDRKFKDDYSAQDYAYENYLKNTKVRIEKYNKITGVYVGYIELRV